MWHQMKQQNHELHEFNSSDKTISILLLMSSLMYLAQSVELVDVSINAALQRRWIKVAERQKVKTKSIWMMDNMLLSLLATLLMGTASALFEDQAFKFDWKQSFIGE